MMMFRIPSFTTTALLVLFSMTRPLVVSGFVLPSQFPLLSTPQEIPTEQIDLIQEHIVVSEDLNPVKETSFAPSLLPSLDEDDEENSPSTTLLELIKSLPNTDVISKLIDDRPELLHDLANPDANLTFFVPTDFAFKHIRYPPPPESITQVVLYHMVHPAFVSNDLEDGQLLVSKHKSDGLLGDNQKIRVQVEEDDDGNVHVHLNERVPIARPDIKASNGVVHLVDQLLLPPPNSFWIVSHHPFEFGIFTLALKHTGLQKELTLTPTLTTFAPTNWAWKQLGIKKLQYLFSNKGKGLLTRIIQFHIVPRTQYTEDLLDHTGQFTLETLLKGDDLHLEVIDTSDEVSLSSRPQTVYVEIEKSATIAHEDLLADNGVIHGIDHVLFPHNADRVLSKKVGEEDDHEEEDQSLSEMLLSLF